MSEYRYYEFRAVDRPLSDADRAALRELSTRARIDSTSFVNSYEWSDLSGAPLDFMRRWFDLHLYVAARGIRRFAIRLPGRLLNRSRLEPFLRSADWVRIEAAGDNAIIDFYDDQREPDASGDRNDGSGWLAALAPLRSDLLSGDWRAFYMVWLRSASKGEIPETATEPLPGLGPLIGPLGAFADFFDIDENLARAAAERPAAAAATAGALRAAVTALPEAEKTAFLQRLAEGEPHVAEDLRRRFRSAAPDDAAASPRRRTFTELRDRAEVLAEESPGERGRAAGSRTPAAGRTVPKSDPTAGRRPPRQRIGRMAQNRSGNREKERPGIRPRH